MPVQTVIKLRRATAANWTTANPVLALGEPGLETDTGKVKYGDGTTAWASLAYSTSDSAYNLYTDVKNSSGSSIAKGTPVYVSSANGTNMLVSVSTNATEVGSSKTLGLLTQTLANNGIGRVITQGLLSGLDTSTATAGDPVWLGVDGALIYGAANKPVAPAHMVFIGIVTRAHATNGEIFVRVQNGFELDELHNVLASTPSNNDTLQYDSTSGLWKNKSSITATSLNASSVSIVAKATNGQTANIQEWQDGTGTVKAKVDSGGNITTPSLNATWSLNAWAGGVAVVPVSVQGVAGQTANLQEWKDSTGTVLSRITSAGNLSWSPNTASSLNSGNGSLTAVISNPALVPVTVKGAASQTADLQQWQNSSGTALAKVDSAGIFTSAAVRLNNAGLNSFGGPAVASQVVTINTNTASYKGLVVQGAASQTADLQQWQDSTGTILAKIDSYGNIDAPNITSPFLLMGA